MTHSPFIRRLILVSALRLTLFGAAADPLYDNGAPANPRTGWEINRWIEADDFTLTVAARIDANRFWDFELPGAFSGTWVWQIYSNTDSNTPGDLIATGISTNLSHAATGVPVFGPYQDFVNDFQMEPIFLPAGAYWLALHNGPLENSSVPGVFWDSSSASAIRPSYAKAAPYLGPWVSNSYPGVDSELAFQLSGAPAPRIVAFDTRQGHPQITFTTTAGQIYRVTYKTDLNASTWTTLPGGDSILGNGSLVQVIDLNASPSTQTRRFYRVEML